MDTNEKFKIGYQTAIALISSEGQLIWRAFSGMLAANTVLITLAGITLKVFPDQAYASRILTIFGIIICLAWFFVLRRLYSYYRLWYAWARHFEKKILTPEVKMITIGKTYGEGGTIEVDSDIPELKKFDWTSRVFRIEWLMAIVILVFVALYTITFFINVAP